MGTKQLTWMGNIAYAQPQGRGEYPGAMCMKFTSINRYNKYFSPGNPGEKYMVIDMTYYRTWWLGIGVLAMVTNQLTKEELDDMMEVDREVQYAMAIRRKEREAAKEKLAREQNAAIQNKERLALVGEKYEARVKHMKSMDPTTEDRKKLEKALNSGDPEVLFADKMEAFTAGLVHGHSQATNTETK